MKFVKNDFVKLKIKIKDVDDNFENLFPKIKDYRGWVDISIEPAVYALFCAVFDLKDKKAVGEKIVELLKFYKEAPLLKNHLKEGQKKRGFSRFIAFIMIREVAKKLDNKENRLFDKFNAFI